jgi:hypothetical protein
MNTKHQRIKMGLNFKSPTVAPTCTNVSDLSNTKQQLARTCTMGIPSAGHELRPKFVPYIVMESEPAPNCAGLGNTADMVGGS